MRNPTSRIGLEKPRAQTEVIGLVLIFTLVLSTISLVLFAGLPLLADEEASTSIEVMDRNFDRWAQTSDATAETDLNKTYIANVPSGVIESSAQTEITIEDQDGNTVAESASTAFAYEPDGSSDQLVFDSGLYFQNQEAMPPTVESSPKSTQWDQIPHTKTLTLYEYDYQGPDTTGGGNDIQLEFESKNDNQPRVTTFDSSDLEIRIETRYSSGWEAYLESNSKYENVDRSDTTITADISLTPEEELHVVIVPIEIEYLA